MFHPTINDVWLHRLLLKIPLTMIQHLLWLIANEIDPAVQKEVYKSSVGFILECSLLLS